MLVRENAEISDTGSKTAIDRGYTWPTNAFFCGPRTYNWLVSKFKNVYMGWGTDEWAQPILTVLQREEPVTDQITIDKMVAKPNWLQWSLKKQPVPYSDVGVYEVSMETILTNYPTIKNKPEFKITIHYPCENLKDAYPNGVYIGYLPDMTIYQNGKPQKITLPLYLTRNEHVKFTLYP